MFGIGFPELIVILAVALIVVGPDKLPEMSRSLAKGMMELKRTVNQVKNSLTEEDNVINSVQSDLRETGDELKEHLREIELRPWETPEARIKEEGMRNGEIIDMDEVRPPEEEDKTGSKLDSGHNPAAGDGFEAPADEGVTEEVNTVQHDSSPAPQ